MINFFELFIVFIVYSFIGYIVEIIVVSAEFKKLMNRGFLCGPICPIYGLGALFMGSILHFYKGDYLVLFVLGALISSILEYFTGWALETIFHNKWWDYSKHKFHINGRVCMSNAIGFGLGAILVVQFANPFFFSLIGKLNYTFVKIISIVLIILFVADLIYSWITAFNLRKNIIIVEELKNNKLNNIPSLIEKRLKSRIDHLRVVPKHIFTSFPKFINKYKTEFDIINKLKLKNKKDK